ARQAGGAATDRRRPQGAGGGARSGQGRAAALAGGNAGGGRPLRPRGGEGCGGRPRRRVQPGHPHPTPVEGGVAGSVGRERPHPHRGVAQSGRRRPGGGNVALRPGVDRVHVPRPGRRVDRRGRPRRRGSLRQLDPRCASGDLQRRRRAHDQTGAGRRLGRRRRGQPSADAARGHGQGWRQVAMLARSQRVSNRSFKEATGWQPAYPTVREGWPAVVEAIGEEGSTLRGPLARLGLAGLAFVALELGVWATIAPRSFYNSFPGGGRHWVAVDGPYNEHLMRDFGGLNLALALVTIVALVAGTRMLVATAA